MGLNNLPITHQSGVVPYRVAGDQLEFLIVSSSSRKRWIVPKGHLEPDMTPQESAALEAYEEGGVRGLMSPDPVTSYRYQKWGRVYQVELFLLDVTQVLTDYPESNDRPRKWVDVQTAIDAVKPAALGQALRIAADRLTHEPLPLPK